MIILGIDPGIASTGYALIDKEKERLRVIKYGCIKTSLHLDHATRLKKIAQELEKIVKKYQPAKAAVEELFFCHNIKTALKVGEARGVVLLTLIKHKLPIEEFTPLEIKQAITTYGRAEKKQIQVMLKVILGLSEIPKPDDAADALAVALTSANSSHL